MTRRRGGSARDDPGMKGLGASGAPVITIVGKTWDLHVREVLRTELDENWKMIRDSVACCAATGAEVFYDAEHFFDGCLANRDYALRTLEAALAGGATRLVLCETSGGSVPWNVCDDGSDVLHTRDPCVQAGVNTKNGGGLAVGIALAAVERVCMQVKGIIIA